MEYLLAKFKADGITERQVVSAKYTLEQQTDKEGQPVGRVRGGKITVTVKSLPDGNSELFDWMCNPYVNKDGHLSFPNRHNDEMKRLIFKEAYMVGYTETYDFTNDDHRQLEQFVITAKEISIGTSVHRNTWTVDD